MNLLHENMDKITQACSDYRVSSLYAFGSIVSGNLSESSDVDFLIEFIQDFEGGAFNQYFGLKEELENILKRNVDLVCYRAIRNPYFKEEVDSTKQELYAA